jgi:glycosyltransferase involved in cell wall biosynthesis
VGENRYSHTFLASMYYYQNLRGSFDVVVSCNNTAPYWVSLCKGDTKHFALYHQLAREVWWYEARFPLSYVGYYLLEPVATFLQSKINSKLITISGSSKQDLIKFGYVSENIGIITEGTDIKPAKDLTAIMKFEIPTVLYFGAFREMKRPDHVVKAFEVLKEKIPNAKLKMAGSTKGKYAQSVLEHIEKSKYKNDIEVLGRVTQEQKVELMQKSHIICVTSIKEGWGLIVTEANSQGTPACVYNVDGLRDSTKHEVTGLVSPSGDVQLLAQSMVQLLENKELYSKLRDNAYAWSKVITFDQCYKDFCKIVNL